MFMRMVHIRHVRVSVFQSAVTVCMGVRLTGWIVEAMLVLVMRIMDMGCACSMGSLTRSCSCCSVM